MTFSWFYCVSIWLRQKVPESNNYLNLHIKFISMTHLNYKNKSLPVGYIIHLLNELTCFVIAINIHFDINRLDIINSFRFYTKKSQINQMVSSLLWWNTRNSVKRLVLNKWIQFSSCILELWSCYDHYVFINTICSR